MEGVADGAMVSKATLYTHFSNKDELFRAVTKRMADMLLTEFARGLQSRGALDDRLAATIARRFRRTWEFVRTPHGADLVTRKRELAGDAFAKAHESMLTMVEGALAEDPLLAPSKKRLARILLLAAGDLAAECASVEDVELELGTFVRTHLAGARVVAKRKSK
jgi:AcrR family transcriptional regulator